MTFVGKIFTVLIFLFSLVFMAFAVMLYETRKNWYDVVMATVAKDQAHPLGLIKQLDNKIKRINKLDQANTDKDNLLMSLKVAHNQAIAELLTQVAEGRKAYQREHELLVKAQQKNGVALAVMGTAQKRARQLTDEVVGLRREIRDEQTDRDKLFTEMVQLTDEVGQRDLQLAELKERGVQVAAQVQIMRDVLQHFGLNKDTPLTGELTELDGIVAGITRTGLIEITIGSDDGLRVSHKLHVFRDNQYVGRIQVTDIQSDKAVCIELVAYKKHRIRRGDRVKTKLKTQIQQIGQIGQIGQVRRRR